MADVSTDHAGRAEADLGVHVGAIHLDLSTVLVDQLTRSLDLGLQDM